MDKVLTMIENVSIKQLAVGLFLILLIVSWYLYISRGHGHTRRYRAKRRLVFFFGDIRRLHHFPWLTWDVHQHSIDLKEASKALEMVREGDIGLHRDLGYLSNLGIPGAFKHAWIHVDDGDCVEAISDGVIRRSALHPLYSDYAIILRPPINEVSSEDVYKAIKNAKKLIGCEYDSEFKFDIEDELKNAEEIDNNEERKILSDHVVNLASQGFDGAFSCTEVVSFSYWHCRRKLEIYRHEYMGKEIIDADTFLKGFDIVWASRKVTPEWAESMGMHEEGVLKISEYRGRVV